MSEQKEINNLPYILVAEYGDPNSNLAQKTSFGTFFNKEEAEEFREAVFGDTNHIVTILPLNDAMAYGIALYEDETGETVTITKN